MGTISAKILSIVLLSVGGSTVTGVLAGLLFRHIPHRLNDIVLGFAAGVMLAASILGLIAPAFEVQGGILLALCGTFAGAALISMLDRLVPHLHRIAGIDTETHRSNGSLGKALLFVTAIALHKKDRGIKILEGNAQAVNILGFFFKAHTDFFLSKKLKAQPKSAKSYWQEEY